MKQKNKGNINKQSQDNKVVANKEKWSQKYPLAIFSIKTFVLLAIVVSIVNHYENKGYFNPDNRNNHTERKWNAFYKFTEKNNVDVLLAGNSHLYTGINPKNLSAALGVNSFILASPGTNIGDTYYAIKEALKVTKPKLVVVETYGMSDFNPYELKGQALSDQFKSFYARKDAMTKLVSMPRLFKTDNYLYAWYNLFRNHDYLYKDTAQLNRNIKLIENPPLEKNELYLGRYVRFTSGIKEDVLKMYDSIGAPVNGDSIHFSSYSKDYINKIQQLCKDEGIELVFLTLPMYHKHVSNYASWHNKLASIVEPLKINWLDLQFNYDSTLFDVNAFENTYSENQHMTYNGSLVATYKLTSFIRDSLKISMINRSDEPIWRNNFYGQEGYFENHPVFATDTKNQLIASNVNFGQLHILEYSVLAIEKNPNKMLMAKVKVPTNFNLENIKKCKLIAAIELLDNGRPIVVNVEMTYDILHPNSEYLIFKSFLKPVPVQSLKAAQLNCAY